MNTGTRHLGALATGALALLSISACTPANPETGPSNTPTSTAPTSESSDSANEVDDPKNLLAIKNACTLLTDEQLTQLGASTTAEPDTTMYGESSCEWSNDNFSTTVALNTTTNSGAAEIREEGRANGTLTQVKGYPALHEGAQSSLCRVEVGVGKDQSFAVNYFLYSGDAPAMQKPCQYAEKIAAEVLENIPDA